jgi:hypothetical protein
VWSATKQKLRQRERVGHSPKNIVLWAMPLDPDRPRRKTVAHTLRKTAAFCSIAIS